MSIEELWKEKLEALDVQKRRLRRCGIGYLKKIFDKEKHVLTSEKIFEIYNSLGLPVEYIFILADSHGLNIDLNGFEKLWREQIDIMKNLKRF